MKAAEKGPVLRRTVRSAGKYDIRGRPQGAGRWLTLEGGLCTSPQRVSFPRRPLPGGSYVFRVRRAHNYYYFIKPRPRRRSCLFGGNEPLKNKWAGPHCTGAHPVCIRFRSLRRALFYAILFMNSNAQQARDRETRKLHVSTSDLAGSSTCYVCGCWGVRRWTCLQRYHRLIGDVGCATILRAWGRTSGRWGLPQNISSPRGRRFRAYKSESKLAAGGRCWDWTSTYMESVTAIFTTGPCGNFPEGQAAQVSFDTLQCKTGQHYVQNHRPQPFAYANYSVPSNDGLAFGQST